MPEEQAFCVLVKVMFDYNMRELFKQGFETLHLKFYQLERLMQASAQLTMSVTDKFWKCKSTPNHIKLRNM